LLLGEVKFSSTPSILDSNGTDYLPARNGV
jgi:hypothetical protein